MKVKFYILFLSLVMFLISCTTTRFVEPLEQGEMAISADLGGPLVRLGGAPIVTPLSSVAVAYGVRKNLTLYGGLHTTSLLYRTLQIDLGVRRSLKKGQGLSPSISWSGGLNAMMDFREYNIRFFPELALNPYWNYGRWRTHLGLKTWFDLYKFANNSYGYGGLFIPVLNVGQAYKWKQWEIVLEYKRLAFNVESKNSVVDYISGTNGANGIYFSIIKKFGHEKAN